MGVAYCRECRVAHEAGKHVAKTVVAPTPVVEEPRPAARVPRDPNDDGGIPRRKKRGLPGSFDKGAYQRIYMKDQRAAKKLKLTVPEYRKMLKRKETNP